PPRRPKAADDPPTGGEQKWALVPLGMLSRKPFGICPPSGGVRRAPASCGSPLDQLPPRGSTASLHTSSAAPHAPLAGRSGRRSPHEWGDKEGHAPHRWPKRPTVPTQV